MKVDNDILIVEARRYTNKLSRTLFDRSNAKTLETRVSRGALGSFALKGVLTGLSLFITLVLTRSLGALDFGVYAYALAWVNFLTIPALVGLDRMLVREVAAGQVQSEWGVVRGLLRWSNAVV